MITLLLNVIIVILALVNLKKYMFYRPPNFPPGKR